MGCCALTLKKNIQADFDHSSSRFGAPSTIPSQDLFRENRIYNLFKSPVKSQALFYGAQLFAQGLMETNHDSKLECHGLRRPEKIGSFH